MADSSSLRLFFSFTVDEETNKLMSGFIEQRIVIIKIIV